MESNRSELPHKSMRQAIIKAAVASSSALLIKDMISTVVDAHSGSTPRAIETENQENFFKQPQDQDTVAEVKETGVGKWNVAVNLCRFRGYPASLRTPQYYQSLLNKISNLFGQMSGGKSGIDFETSQVTGWTELKETYEEFLNPDGSKNLDLMRHSCQIANDASVDYKGKNVVLDVLSHNNLGGFSARETLNLDGNTAKVNSILVADDYASELSGVLHEFLHLYLRHPMVLVGQEQDGTPKYDDNIDWWTPMGNPWKTGKEDSKFGHLPVQLTGAERKKLGWEKNYVLLEGTEKQSFDLSFLDLDIKNGTQIIEVPLTGQSLFIEARQRSESDPVPSTGVIAHLYDGERIYLVVPDGATATDALKENMWMEVDGVVINVLKSIDGGFKIEVFKKTISQSTAVPAATPTEEKINVYLPNVSNRDKR